MERTKQYRNRIYGFLCDPRTRTCLLATAIFGTLSYLYLFVNNINNNDMIVCLPEGYGTGLTSGRWGLYFLGEVTRRIWGVYNVPVFNGVLALLLLALSSAVLVRVLELRHRGLCFALAAITAVFAPIGALMFFGFTAHYYALAIALMAAAACLLKQRRWTAFFAGSLLAACSLGIYQAYFPFLAALLLLTLLGSCLQRGTTGKEIFLDALRMLAALVLSYLLYALILKGFLALRHAALSNYQGISQMGQIRDLPKLIWNTYLRFFRLPFDDLASVNATHIVRIVMAALFLLSVAALPLFWRERKVGKILLACLFLLLLPLAANAIVLLSGGSAIYTRMCFGLIAVFYLPLLTAQRLPFRKAAWEKVAVVTVSLLVLLASANYVWQNNGNYQAAYYANRKTENYFAAMFTRLRSLDGYRSDMEIVLVGDRITDEKFYDNYYGTPFHYSAYIGASDQINEYSRMSFLANYYGISVRCADAEELARYAGDFASLTAYPDDGCMAILDGTVYVVLETPAG